MNGHPKFSVITPIYNSSEYIDRYFEALKNQSFKDFEIIIIDDCSQDNSYEKVCKASRVFPANVTVLEADNNGGAGYARNIGLNIAQGEYVLFVDGDDYVDWRLFEKLETIGDAPDAILFDYYRKNGTSKHICRTLYKCSEGRVTRDECLKRLSSNVCGKAIKKKIIDDMELRFPAIKRYEDWAFMVCALSKCEIIHYIRQPLYVYVDNPKSTTHTFGEKTRQCAENAFLYIKSQCEISEDVLEILYVKEVVCSLIKEYLYNGNTQIVDDTAQDNCAVSIKINYIEYLSIKKIILLILYKYNLCGIFRYIIRKIFWESVI